MSTADRPTTTAPRPRLPPVAYVLAAGTFLMATSEFLVAGLLPELASDFGVTVAQAGLSITVFAVGMIVGSPTMVLLTLRLPRRSTLVLALLLFAAGHVVAALSGAYALMLGARFITAVATGAFWAVSGLVVAEAAGPGASSRAMGVVQGGGMLATVVGVPLGTFAGQLVGWREPFWMLAGLAVVAAPVIARLVPHVPSSTVPSIRNELTALRSGRLWVVLASCALVTGGVLSVFSYVSPLLTERTGLPDSAVPVVLVVFGVAALIGTLVAGRLGDAHPYGTVLVAGVITVCAVVGLALASTVPAPTVALFAVLGFAGLSANPILGLLAIRFGGSAATLAGALTPSAFNVGTALGTGITAAALDGPLGTLAPLAVGGVSGVLLLGTFGSLALATRKRPAVPAEHPALHAPVPAEGCA